MQEFIDKLIGRLEEITISRNSDGVINGCNMGICEDDDCLKCLKKKITSIIKELAEEYKQDTTFQYVLLQTNILKRMGIDVSCKWETATQNAMALERAYMRGRQDEIDRFTEWKEQHNNGWISCSERLPEVNGWYLVTNVLGVVQQQCWSANHWQKLSDDAVIAWQPLPPAYKEGGV